jgi:signal transduction histidine kinase
MAVMNITLIFFVYGLAFFTMGLAMMFESGRSPIMVARRVLIPLAVFGLIHGAHEWIEMFLIHSSWLVLEHPNFWGVLRILILGISFSALSIFGYQVLYAGRRMIQIERRNWNIGISIYLLAIVTIVIFLWYYHGDSIETFDIASRYLLAVPGAAIASLGLFREAQRASQGGSPLKARAFQVAALGFGVYAISQLVVPPADFFPASMLNTATFREAAGMPVQLIRAAAAIVITLALVRATQFNEAERKRQFEQAQQARMDALQQLEAEMIEREKMRTELVRHIVQAQEEERARIARELHDETSQTLTAFTFHLAALGSVLQNDPKTAKQLDHLRSLSRRMATGIYRLVHDLRPAQLDDLGLVAALHYLGDEAEKQMGLAVQVDVSGERRRLEPLVETSLYRIAQEALTNTARHAGVPEASIEIAFEPDRVILLLSDLGLGFDLDQVKNDSWGLAGIRERAELIGADLKIITGPGQGTCVEVAVPFHEPKESPE